MNLKALLLKLYFNAESAYYEFLDAVDKPLPIYKFLVNPIEDKGYPSFPVYCALFLLLLVVLFISSAASAPQVSNLYVEVHSSSQHLPLPGTAVAVYATTGGDYLQAVASGVTDANGRVGFVGIPVKSLRLQVSKQGYISESVSLDEFPGTRLSVELEPTVETQRVIQQQAQAQREFLNEVERLKNSGFPEFAEAIEQANVIVSQGSESG